MLNFAQPPALPTTPQPQKCEAKPRERNLYAKENLCDLMLQRKLGGITTRVFNIWDIN